MDKQHLNRFRRLAEREILKDVYAPRAPLGTHTPTSGWGNADALWITDPVTASNPGDEG